MLVQNMSGSLQQWWHKHFLSCATHRLHGGHDKWFVWKSVFMLMTPYYKWEICHIRGSTRRRSISTFASVELLQYMCPVWSGWDPLRWYRAACVITTRPQLRTASSLVTNLIPSDSFHIISTSSPSREKRKLWKWRLKVNPKQSSVL